MNKLLFSAACVLAIYGTQAQAQAMSDRETAVSITPVIESTQRTECQAAPTGGGWLGQALGGVLGAGLGSQVGKGSGQSAAAAAGAVLGAQAGAAVTNNGQGQRCQTVIDKALIGSRSTLTTGA